MHSKIKKRTIKAPKSMIYTKTGDDGTTSLVGGKRVMKTDIRLEAYGTADELNSLVGLLATYVDDEDDRKLLEEIQNVLFVVGGYLATDQGSTDLMPQTLVSPEMVGNIEAGIDRIDATLPLLRAFVLPGGSRGAAVAHVARTVCRRCERCILRMNECLVADGSTAISPDVLAFINRLSDFLFVLARKLNIISNKEEIIWKNACR